MKKCLYLMILFLIFPKTGESQKKPNCLYPRCHGHLIEGKVIHRPVEAGECKSCHKSKKKGHPIAKGKEWQFEQDTIAELCASCHDVSPEDSDHSPIAEGECLSCHDPHLSPQPKLLPGNTGADLCGICHTTGMEDKDWVHGPVAVGACEACHRAHGNTEDSLIPGGNRTEVCYQCHEAKKEIFGTYEYLHGPVATSCADCHNPHETEHRYMLSDEIPAACFSCHPVIADAVTGAISKHDALSEEKPCQNCHKTHGSNYRYNLQYEPLDLCLNCHDRPLKTEDGMLANTKKILDEQPDWHGPIKERNCSGCHNPHGSVDRRLLIDYFSADFYNHYEVDKYRLCFQCHEAANFQDEISTLTNFRNGDKNFHYVHVNREKGRTCRACHDVHASEHPFHIREAVSFGPNDWALPLNFVPSPDGGSCLPGCHKLLEYKR